MDGESGSGHLLFEAVIVPHRSLSRRGRRILISAICLVSGLMMLGFVALHVWPVVGFGVAESGLAVGLLLVNARQGRSVELVMLSEEALRVIRVDAAGQRDERMISPAWLNVVLEHEPGRVPRLILAAHRVREEIGTALGETEKRDLAAALAAALHRLCHPEFDNPQLRE